ncbi:hypothetical protein Q9233_015855 [Columba guinea]|nr:hypothetical protein Q9233_015855 [Columba guinea]
MSVLFSFLIFGYRSKREFSKPLVRITPADLLPAAGELAGEDEGCRAEDEGCRAVSDTRIMFELFQVVTRTRFWFCTITDQQEVATRLPQVALALIILKFPVGKVTCIIIGAPDQSRSWVDADVRMPCLLEATFVHRGPLWSRRPLGLERSIQHLGYIWVLALVGGDASSKSPSWAALRGTSLWCSLLVTHALHVLGEGWCLQHALEDEDEEEEGFPSLLACPTGELCSRDHSGVLSLAL